MTTIVVSKDSSNLSEEIAIFPDSEFQIYGHDGHWGRELTKEHITVGLSEGKVPFAYVVGKGEIRFFEAKEGEGSSASGFTRTNGREVFVQFLTGKTEEAYWSGRKEAR